jgi:hypothetical protein
MAMARSNAATSLLDIPKAGLLSTCDPMLDHQFGISFLAGVHGERPSVLPPIAEVIGKTGSNQTLQLRCSTAYVTFETSAVVAPYPV